jgi:hypothetical protein
MAPALTTTRDIPFDDIQIHGHAVVNNSWHFYLIEQDDTVMKGYMCQHPCSFTEHQVGTLNIKELSDPDVWGVEVKWEEDWAVQPVRKVLA